VGWLVWQACVDAVDNPQWAAQLLGQAHSIYGWLKERGYGHLLLENVLSQLPMANTPNADAMTVPMLPPAECPLSKGDWQQAQALLPVLQSGLIIAAHACPNTDALFGAVQQNPTPPWAIVHAGWLWLWENWLHQDPSFAWGAPLQTTCALLRQSIDTVVLHRMLLQDVGG
jgi:hypothetical protein